MREQCSECKKYTGKCPACHRYLPNIGADYEEIDEATALKDPTAEWDMKIGGPDHGFSGYWDPVKGGEFGGKYNATNDDKSLYAFRRPLYRNISAGEATALWKQHKEVQFLHGTGWKVLRAGCNVTEETRFRVKIERKA